MIQPDIRAGGSKFTDAGKGKGDGGRCCSSLPTDAGGAFDVSDGGGRAFGGADGDGSCCWLLMDATGDGASGGPFFLVL
eukprot:scaffold128_cov140-Skeletonema_menzelii.AAC.30